MRLRDPAHRTPLAAGLAAGGVLAGHTIVYALVAPEGEARARLLESTGHAYLPAATGFALLALLITIGVLFLARLTRPSATPVGRSIAVRIATVQVSSFVGIELFERISSGAPLGGVLHGGLLPVGIVVQLVIAGAIAVLIRLLLHVADRAAVAFGPRRLLRTRGVLAPLPNVLTTRGRIYDLLPTGRSPPSPR